MDTTEIKEGIEQREYEVAVLVPREELVSPILKILSQHKIEIKSEGSVRKIKLAYDIKKATEAYFVFFQVVALPESIKLLEVNLRANTDVLRFLIIHLPGTKSERDEASKRASRGPSRRPGIAPMESHQPKTLSNEAIEKKIEEILQ